MSDAGDTLRALRAAFDRAFVDAPAAAAAPPVALLALRAGGEPVAVRVLAAAGLLPARPIVPVPSRRPELLGVAGVRGALVPVWSAARLLGRADAAAPAWIVLAAAGPSRVGFAFEAFEGHLLAGPDDIVLGAAAGPHVAGAARAGGVARPLLDLASLAEAVTRPPPAEPSR